MDNCFTSVPYSSLTLKCAEIKSSSAPGIPRTPTELETLDLHNEVSDQAISIDAEKASDSLWTGNKWRVIPVSQSFEKVKFPPILMYGKSGNAAIN